MFFSFPFSRVGFSRIGAPWMRSHASIKMKESKVKKCCITSNLFLSDNNCSFYI